MRRFLGILLLLIFSVFVGVKIAEDPGYTIFAYRQWTMEMPLWFFVLAFILILSFLYVFIRFFDSIDASFSGWKNWLRLRRKQKSYSKTNRGLLELIEANWKSAENNLMSGVDQSDAPLINFLAAAKAAHEQSAYDRRDKYLRKAYDLSPQTHTAVGLMQAQLQLDQGKLEQAFATLTQLHQKFPKQVLVLKLLQRACVRLGDWKKLLQLIPELKKAKLISLEQMETLEQSTYSELLKVIKKKGNLKELRQLWEEMPRDLHRKPEAVDHYTKALLAFPGTQEEVEALIVQTLKYHWYDNLVKLYGSLNLDSVKQLKVAESWEKTYGASPILYLILGRFNMRNQIWGKARYYFQECIKLNPHLTEAYLEYSGLLLQLDEQPAALKVSREGLQNSLKF